ncbi:hypothetical protein [Peribacillus frigoritolerans]
MELEKLKGDIEQLKNNPNTMYKAITLSAKYDFLWNVISSWKIQN